MILQSIKMALKSIKTNKLRSFLTMLGIIIGVFALVVLVSLVSGATNTITESISDIGSDMISVTMLDWGANNRLSIKEVESLADKLPNVAATAPAAQGSIDAKTKLKTENVMVYGTTPAYAEIQGYKMKYGRFLMKPDCENHTNVVVLNHDAAITFFGRDNCIGETLKLNGRAYRVIGVVDSGNQQMSMMSMLLNGGGMYTVYIPYTSLIRLASGIKLSVDSFYASAVDGNTGAAKDEINDYMMDKYGDEDMFYIFSQSEISEAMDKVTGTLSLLLGGIAAISLLVGGIGIMNIMLVSVTERTREIGIRKAIGAQPGVIRLQFLIEAMTLSIVGCLLGIVLSWITLQIINILANVSFGLSIPVILLSVLFSSGVGILFGIYPAHKAAKMKPIDALRFS
ncbi:putative ABC transport system permease protein [Ruminococcaceae bacterium YRB3002]|nr:putative ABC transport system permease protein [Ruminococcaceae bacterium YRB3002]